MQIVDIVHGYQPFSRNDAPPWVLRNLKRIFLPTSEAMKKGIVHRNVQLQGWTIDNWLSSHKSISETAAHTLQNLREAKDDGNIDIGFSAYSHPILPFLSDAMTYAQLKADYLTVFSHIGKPNFLWFPEGATDKRILKIATYGFPNNIILVPNKCIPSLKSGFFEFNSLGKKSTIALFDVLVKDTLMGAPYFKEKYEYAPKSLNWEKAQKAMRDPNSLMHTLKAIEGDLSEYFIVRDWENGESKESLIRDGPIKEVKAFCEGSKSKRLSFLRFSEMDSQIENSEKILPENIIAGSWEPLATQGDPYPYWKPLFNKNEKVMKAVATWNEFIKYFDAIFQESINNLYGDQAVSTTPNMKRHVDLFLKDEQNLELFKKSAPALISCVPWHLTARQEWESAPELPVYFSKKVLLPSSDALCELYERCGGDNTKEVWKNLKGILDKFILEAQSVANPSLAKNP